MNRHFLRDIADIQTGPFGSQLHKDDYVDIGTPIVTVEHLGNRVFTEQNLPKVSDEDKARLSKYVLKEGDIVFSRVGSVDRCSYVDAAHDGWMFSGRCLRVRPNTEVDPLYLYYFFCLEDTKQFVRNIAVGATMPSINTKLLGEVEVAYPSQTEQQKIVALLSALDDKIEINQKINDNLEQQIKTIFTFQFLQNANTEWKQQSLAELSEMYQPKTISGKDLIAVGNYFVYGANGIIGKYNQYNHSESEIAVACRGASCGSIQMTLPFSWITGNAMVVKPHSNFPYREYLYYYLLAKNPNYLCSGSAQPQLTRENLTLYSLKVPSTTELNAFENYAEKVRKIIIKNQQENIELSTLRDWLLPMLMNGQAIISD